MTEKEEEQEDFFAEKPGDKPEEIRSKKFLKLVEEQNGGREGMNAMCKRLHQYPEIYRAWFGFMDMSTKVVALGAIEPERMAEIITQTNKACFSEEGLLIIASEMKAFGDPALLTEEQKNACRERLHALLDQMGAPGKEAILVKVSNAEAAMLKASGFESAFEKKRPKTAPYPSKETVH
jgi:hypothetical protein